MKRVPCIITLAFLDDKANPICISVYNYSDRYSAQGHGAVVLILMVFSSCRHVSLLTILCIYLFLCQTLSFFHSSCFLLLFRSNPAWGRKKPKNIERRREQLSHTLSCHDILYKVEIVFEYFLSRVLK